MDKVAIREKEKRAILYCRSVKGNYADLQKSKQSIERICQSKRIISSSHLLGKCGTMDALTYNNLRLQAKYREFEILLIPELEVLGNSAIEITEEVNFLTENGVKVLSIKDGELNI